MPKLFKRPGSSVYYYRVFKDGKDIWKSAGESDKKKAQAIYRGRPFPPPAFMIRLSESVSQVLSTTGRNPDQQDVINGNTVAWVYRLDEFGNYAYYLPNGVVAQINHAS